MEACYYSLRHVTYPLILKNITGTAFESRALSPLNVLLLQLFLFFFLGVSIFSLQLSIEQVGAFKTCSWVSVRAPVRLGLTGRLHQADFFLLAFGRVWHHLSLSWHLVGTAGLPSVFAYLSSLQATPGPEFLCYLLPVEPAYAGAENLCHRLVLGCLSLLRGPALPQPVAGSTVLDLASRHKVYA